MLKRLNHVAIAVPDSEQAAAHYGLVFGMTPSSVQILPEHGVKVVFVETENMKIEFISPLDDTSPIANFLEKNPKGGIHHLCFEVDDVTKSLAHLQSININPVGFKEPRIGAHGNPVIFLSPKDFYGTLLELEEIPS
ncbi:MAG: methylmalonyl-CoA epimerase [Alphaproteobacteria bacterium]|jgi:methylmalonyl-CoA/ethylmalonyl-CoA epimerase|nr:methylmalonyl-CoA epimerase [Alphaproteobacteria bacterium]MBP9877234.1 methylmalonyl-CoA epimerase [Alphaproteobacteria bacterium]